MKEKIIVVQEQLNCAIFIMESLKAERVPEKDTLLFPCDYEMLKHIDIESYDLIISDKQEICDRYLFSIKFVSNDEWGKCLTPELYYKIGVWQGILEEKAMTLVG